MHLIYSWVDWNKSIEVPCSRTQDCGQAGFELLFFLRLQVRHANHLTTVLPMMLWICSAVVSVHLHFNLISCSPFLQQLPVVPLFGDMQIALADYIKNCPHFDGMKDKWTCCAETADEKVVVQYNLMAKIDSIKEEHIRFISELARYNNEVCTDLNRSCSQEILTIEQYFVWYLLLIQSESSFEQLPCLLTDFLSNNFIA